MVLAGTVSGLALCMAVGAVTTESGDNPYQTIVDRNVFALKPPPPPPNPEDNKPPPSKNTLTGITTILCRKLALMKTPPPPAKPGEQAKTEGSYILAPGQREGEIEVLEIDEIAGSVKVNNGGTVETLTFKENGAKLPASAAPGPGTGVPMPPGVVPPPVAPAGFTPPGGFNPGFNPIRPIRTSQPGNPGTSAGIPSPGFGIPTAPVNPGGVSLPSFGTPAAQQQTAVQQPQLSPEEQIIAMEAARKVTENQVASGKLPPIPPTPLTPAGAPGSVAPVQNQPNQQNPTPVPVMPPIPGRPQLPPLPGSR